MNIVKLEEKTIREFVDLALDVIKHYRNDMNKAMELMETVVSYSAECKIERRSKIINECERYLGEIKNIQKELWKLLFCISNDKEKVVLTEEKDLWKKLIIACQQQIKNIKKIGNLTEQTEKSLIDSCKIIIEVWRNFDNIKLIIKRCDKSINGIPDNIIDINNIKNNYNNIPSEIRRSMENEIINYCQQLTDSNSREIINLIWNQSKR